MTTKKKDWLTIGVIIVIVMVFAVWFYLPDYLLAKYGPVENAGSYGDAYGSVTALFTSLAFALLIYTALMQREELQLQRQELELTRKELAKSAEAQQEIVKLTKENNEFQKFIRRNEAKPELLIGDQDVSAEISDGPKKLKTTINLFNQFTPLIPVSVTLYEYSSRVILSVPDFMILKVLDPGFFFGFVIYHDAHEDLKKCRIQLNVDDVDRRHTYLQDITFDGFAFRISEPIRVSGVKT